MTPTPFPERISAQYLSELADSIRTAGDRDEISIHNPATDVEIGTVPAGTEADVAAAIERAQSAQEAWASRSVESRARVIRRFHDLVLQHRQRILDLVQLESSKARLDALYEVLDVANTARYYGHRAPGQLAADSRRGGVPFLTRTYVEYPPVGVVGVISPWNYPLTLSVGDAIPALLAGNTVLLTPASATPYTALLIRDILSAAGLPEDVFQVLTGRGSEIGGELVDAVDFVVFTGSTETGRTVASRAGETLTDVTLELGGKNPMLVLADADLDRAVEDVRYGAFSNAGQLCLAIERLYVQRAVFEPFLDKLLARLSTLELGASYDYGPDIGSLIGQDQLETVKSHVETARAEGATVRTGGTHRPDIGPYFYEPTVLTEVDPSMAVTCEETFGPVLTVQPFDTLNEGIGMANDSAYGLNASVFTSDSTTGQEVASQLDAGTVNINGAYAPAWGSIDAPMGGMKDSGIGRRHGPEGIRKFTEARTVSEQRGPSIHPPRWLPESWYERGMTGMLGLFERLAGFR